MMTAVPNISVMRELPTWPVAAGSLILGFGVAEITGVRPLAGLVLLAGAGWCALRWRRAAGAGRTGLLVALYAAVFAGSHVAADALGAWPSVLLAAAVMGAGAWSLADARPRTAAV